MSSWIQPSQAVSIGEGSTTREPHNQGRPRYGVDIRGPSVHAEVDELAEVLTVANGYAGTANVVDTQTKALVFHGTMDELRQAMRTNAGPTTHDSPTVAE